MSQITVQIHHNGEWHDAALVDAESEQAGIASPSVVDYDMGYVVHWDAEGLAIGEPAFDHRAVSVGYPTDFTPRRRPDWPPFLLDMLPQGTARKRLAAKLGFKNSDDRAVDYPLLLMAGGGPIGNLRIKEAWEQERSRLQHQEFRGLPDAEIFERSDRFGDIIDRFALIGTGSSGVQGDWPKALLTKAVDGLWYPDPLIDDVDAREHAIVKLLRDREQAYADILAAEAPYLEVARAFGLRVGKALIYADGILVIPRFDREVVGSQVIRHGQESLVSAIGIAEFGYHGSHEDYLAVIKKVSTRPADEVTEYVLRDVLNFAMGNPDNHGRNSALQKRADGHIGLTPLFDFTPMRLDPTMVVRSTRWRCLKGRDADPDWGLVCEAAAEGVMDAADLKAALATKHNFLRALPDTARRLGIADATIERAFTRLDDLVRALEAIGRGG
jgi:serine/threonine-protein kinase HipA